MELPNFSGISFRILIAQLKKHLRILKNSGCMASKHSWFDKTWNIQLFL